MLIEKAYQRERAVAYAERWALSRNPLFADFSELGGNCTNFVSQCLLAGACTMNYTEDFGWYYISVRDRAPAWTGVEYFYDFITGAPAFREQNRGIGPFGTEVTRFDVERGDVVQYADEEGKWYHSVLVSDFDGEEILVAAQTEDAYDRPLSSYNFSMARFLHIEGVRLEIQDEACFEILMRGSI